MKTSFLFLLLIAFGLFSCQNNNYYTLDDFPEVPKIDAHYHIYTDNIDHPQLDPVFQHLADNNIPLVGHLGEPKNCWLPLDEMTTKNDSNYFANNPQYHMYKHPEYPSYEEQMAARDRMLDKHPDLTFIGCHLASLEWSVDEMAAFPDRFPNAAMDMAVRMGQLFYQTRENREVRVRMR